MRHQALAAAVLLLFGAIPPGMSASEAAEDFWLREGRIYPALPIAVTTSADESCRADSELLVRHLRNKTLWAVKMWDSSAKAPVGVLHGSTYQLGNFDECLRVTTPVTSQFCVAQVVADVPDSYPTPDDPFSLDGEPTSSVWTQIRGSRIDPSKVPRDVINWGLCVPASCSSSDLENGINEYLRSLERSAPNDTTYTVKVKSEFCTAANERRDFTLGEISFWLFTCLLIALAVSSTIADRAGEKEDSRWRRLWMSFSIRRNALKLIKPPEESVRDNPTSILHGIKALSIILIVFGHRLGLSLALSATNFQDIEEHLRTESTVFFVHTDLVVDTFFFISGLIACFFLMKTFDAAAVKPFVAILVRMLRLAPAYFFLVWYQASAASRFGSGPLWKALAEGENRFCAKNWWANVLFISNYVNPKQMCMTHSWYIPCDFHFFIVATFLVVLLVKRRRTGIILLAVLTAVSAVVPAIVTYVHGIQPMIIFYHDFLASPRDNESFHTLYVKSHNRATVYLIGMSVGLFLYSYKDSVKRVSKKITVSSFFVWLLLMFAPMWYGSLYYTAGRSYDAVEAAIFSSARRISWAVGFSIFVVAHRFGTIPVLSKGLSSKPAFFLSNISYGVYLLHFNLITADVFRSRTSKPFTVGNLVSEGMWDLFISGLIAVILFLLLEMPCKRIIRDLVLGKQRQITETPGFKQQQQQELQFVNNNNHPVTNETTTSCTVKL